MGLVDALMEGRDKEIQKTAKQPDKAGGMFDFIFRAKKQREQEIKGIEDQENDNPTAETK